MTIETVVNLEDLRSELGRRLTLLLMVATGFFVTLFLPMIPYPGLPSLLLFLLFLWGAATWLVSYGRPVLSRYMLVFGMLGALLAGMALLNDPWLPWLGILLILMGAMLIPWADLLSAALIAALAAGLNLSGLRAYPLDHLWAVLALAVATARFGVRTMYTALDWVSRLQERTVRLLEEARDRQGELNSTLKSLDLAYHLQRRTQDELLIARRQAEEARRMKEQFAANISHELRTPLALILGFSEVMHRTPQVYGDMAWPPTLRRDVYQIYRNSRHLLEMIDDVLDLSRFEIVGFTLNKEPTPLTPLLQGAAEIAQSLFRGQPVQLEVMVPPDLPTLEIDPTRIRQVLLNLLSNARRFTPQGKVRLEAHCTDGEVTVSVSDTGRGIPADKLPMIFDEFYQVDASLRRGQGGAGLGLAICKRFVQVHGGRIWAESQEGAGSTFSFSLPVPGLRPALPNLTMQRPVDRSPSGAHPALLVLDPDADVAALVRRRVEGYTVVPVPATSGLAGAVALYRPRAIICNVAPGKALPFDPSALPAVPIIQCSLPKYGWVAEDLGVAACLAKPIAAQQLLEQIDRLGKVRDIMIIDDDRGFCQFLERILAVSGQGFVVRHAYDGEEGLLAMRVRRPDLVLLDLIMPHVDGFQVLQEMHGDPTLAQTPVMVLTAASNDDDMLARRSDRIAVSRRDGLRPVEALRCLQAMLDVIDAHYDDQPTTPPAHATRPGYHPG